MSEAAFLTFVVTAGTIVVAYGFRERQAQRHRQNALVVVLQTATLDASRRGHSHTTPAHLLWVLLDVPEVAAGWKARGWPLVDARDALRAKLGEPNADPNGQSQADLSTELLGLVRRAARAAAARGGSPRVACRAMISALVRESLTVEAIARLLPGGSRCPYDTFSLDPLDQRIDEDASAQEGPYRSASAPPVVDIVFWNDGRTTMAVVIEILTHVFDMSETRAAYVMLATHHLSRSYTSCCAGSAAVISCGSAAPFRS